MTYSVLHPCWERQRGELVLGISGCRIWHLLADKVPRTLTQLVHLSHYSKGTVKRALERLQQVGLVTRQSDKTWLPLVQDLDEVAEWIGADRRPDKRRSGNVEARKRRRATQQQWVRQHVGVPAGVDPTTGEILGSMDGPFGHDGATEPTRISPAEYVDLVGASAQHLEVRQCAA